MTRYKTKLTHLSIKTSLVLLFLCTAVSGFSQNDTVRINSDYQIMYCSATNGTVLPMQEIQLLLEGPKDKKWFVSFSVNNSPAMILNGNEGINFSEYNMSLFFKNTSGHVKNYTIELKKAWLEDLSPVVIPEKYKSATVQVMPLATPEIEDYHPKVKINTSQKYSAKIGKNSSYSVWVPEGAAILKNESKIEDHKQEIELKIKWPDHEASNYFKLIETDAFGCNSDTIFAGLEVVKSFQVTFDDNNNLCEGESLVLTPIIDLPSNYSYLWSTGENTKEISVDKEGTYNLTVTDLNDNQVVKSKIEVSTQKSPVINLEDHVVIEDENSILDIFQKGSTYLWSDGSTDSELSISKSGKYSVTVVSSNGCSSTKSFSAKMKSELFEINLPEVIQLCGNQKMNLEPSLSINQEYRYLWKNGSSEPSIDIDKAGEYWVKITDPDGFQQTANTKVIYHPNPIIDLGADITLWDEESVVLDAGNEGAEFIWNTGENTQSINVNSGGVFVVEVKDHNGCLNKDTLYVNHRKGEKFGVFLGEDHSICSGDSILINPIIEGNPVYPLQYNWLGLANKTPEIYLKENGHYCLEVTDANGNTESDCLEINLLPTPKIDLGQDLESYADKKIVLDAGTPNCFYKWVTGDITRKITVQTEGRYWVEVTTDSNCTASDTIDVAFLENYPYVGLPKAFSPNGDGHNDKLFIRGEDVKEVTLIIYNRLGQKLFETTNINSGWDGFFKGQMQDIDVYVYVLEVTFLDGKKVMKKGNVALLR
ncbi:gliding motility-associated C-terminal domain-containing protein [Labilibaculum sp. K2S]|uniref:gliding motility-associated C-terminal domain-containing protein n=1 Tax=Labilibaculum sp. K2S TaxID=3056386 RepID=UPI0025A4A044|nr:gliding motility-associated C-terminal domain-containing protein [Labilibaculum sp. K2S]MDM8160179.1 gliding motility-associated C-terminal domain-containing protein [Labilibaculum sp. K2S]